VNGVGRVHEGRGRASGIHGRYDFLGNDGTLAHAADDHPSFAGSDAFHGVYERVVDIDFHRGDGGGFFANDVQGRCLNVSFGHGWVQNYDFQKVQKLRKAEFLTKSARFGPLDFVTSPTPEKGLADSGKRLLIFPRILINLRLYTV
jgi:hypothetical protein